MKFEVTYNLLMPATAFIEAEDEQTAKEEVFKSLDKTNTFENRSYQLKATPLCSKEELKEFVIRSIEKAALDWQDVTWLSKDMIEMHDKDAKDMREVAKLIKEDEPKAAYKKYKHLDTAVRECFPEFITDYLVEQSK